VTGVQTCALPISVFLRTFCTVSHIAKRLHTLNRSIPSTSAHTSGRHRASDAPYLTLRKKRLRAISQRPQFVHTRFLSNDRMRRSHLATNPEAPSRSTAQVEHRVLHSAELSLYTLFHLNNARANGRLPSFQ